MEGQKLIADGLRSRQKRRPRAWLEPGAPRKRLAPGSSWLQPGA